MLEAREVALPANMTLAVTLEHAVTADQLAWGLMQRRALPENHGMTFTYPLPDFQRFWMFNCNINLSVAFLDERKVIKQITPMMAHPERMDPRRPVRNAAEMTKYSFNEPIVQFYFARSVQSTFRSRYALEMNLNWFQNHGVGLDDVVWWENNSPGGVVIRTIDLSSYLPLTEPLVLTFPDAAFRSLKFPKEAKFYEVQFLDGKEPVDKRIVSYHQPVICYRRVSTIVVSLVR